MSQESKNLQTSARGMITPQKVGNFVLNNALIILMVIAVIYIAIINPNFLSTGSIVNIISQTAAYLPAALGIGGCIVLTGTDLSAGRIVGLTACVSASLLQSTLNMANKMWPEIGALPIPVVIVVAMVIGAAIGAFNGFFVAKFKLHPFIVTLGTQLIVYTLLLIYVTMGNNNGMAIANLDKSYTDFVKGEMFNIGGASVPWYVLYAVILTFVMCVELIQMVTERNNLHDIDTWMFFKWVFKTFCAVLIVTNTWNIVMGIFDAAQSVVNGSAGVIIGNTSVDISGVLGNLDAQMEALETGELFGLWFQSIFVGLTMNILSICIMLVIYGRMIEVYLTASVGPIPLATMTNRDWGHTGQNYLRSLFALGFQAFLIMVCVGIYSVLVQNIGVGSNVSAAIWACMGYTVLLCFALFKTGSLSKSLFGAH